MIRDIFQNNKYYFRCGIIRHMRSESGQIQMKVHIKKVPAGTFFYMSNMVKLIYIIVMKGDVADRENLQYQVIEQTKDHVVVHKDHPIRDTFRDIFLKNEGESQVEQTKK